MQLPPTSYIGDAVYISNDGYHVVLTTGHHEPVHAQAVIKLEPEVAQALYTKLKLMFNPQ